MARRAKSAGNPLLVLLLGALVVLAIAAPFLLALWVLIAEAQAWPFRGRRRLSDLVDGSERVSISAAEEEIGRLEAALAAQINSGDTRGFERRADGLFDARNPEARALNSELERLASLIQAAREQLELVRRPLETRLERFVAARSNLLAARTALTAFVLVYGLTLAIQISNTGAPVTLAALVPGAGAPAEAQMAASLLGALVSAIAAWIARGQVRASLLA